MRNVLVLSVLAVLGMPAIASADQCALNSAPVTSRASSFLKPGNWLIDFCEPCRDKAPGTPYEIKTLQIKDGQVTINGSLKDLAYVFVKLKADEYRNVGLATQCGAADVSAWIINGKPTGPTSRTQVRPPLPPPPPRPPMSRVTSPDELIGNWTVRLTTRMTTCGGVAKDVPTHPLAHSEEIWSIDSVGGTITILLAGGQQLEGSVGSIQLGAYRHRLNGKQKPTELVLDLTHAVKNRFYGTLIKTEQVAARGRAHCITMFDVTGTQQPAP